MMTSFNVFYAAKFSEKQQQHQEKKLKTMQKDIKLKEKDFVNINVKGYCDLYEKIMEY